MVLAVVFFITIYSIEWKWKCLRVLTKFPFNVFVVDFCLKMYNGCSYFSESFSGQFREEWEMDRIYVRFYKQMPFSFNVTGILGNFPLFASCYNTRRINDFYLKEWQ